MPPRSIAPITVGPDHNQEVSYESAWGHLKEKLNEKSSDVTSLKVYIRQRPISKKEAAENSPVCVSVDEAANIISLKKEGEKAKVEDFTFDRTFRECGQEDVFRSVGMDLISNSLRVSSYARARAKYLLL